MIRLILESTWKHTCIITDQKGNGIKAANISVVLQEIKSENAGGNGDENLAEEQQDIGYTG